MNPNKMSNGQILSWYHSKIPRITHGKQNPSKRYISEEDILKLFDGVVHIQEKVDGNLSDKGIYSGQLGYNQIDIEEDMTGKNTCHKHIEYTNLPRTKRIYLDSILISDGTLEILSVYQFTTLDYTILNGSVLDIKQIYLILELFSRLPSHFGRERIEGLVIKNYDKQLMGKWINDEFEDHLKEAEKK